MPLPKVSYPTYTTKVPSTDETVKYRPFTVREEKILLTALQGDDQKEILSAVSDIIDACFMGKLSIDKLSTYDIEFLFLQLRIKSVSGLVDLQFRNNSCPEESGEPCKKTVAMKINLEDIRVQIKKDNEFVEFKPENKTKLGYQIKLAEDIGVTMRHPGIKEIEEADKIENEYEKLITLIRLCVTSVFDSETVTTSDEFDIEEFKEFYDSLLSTQQKELIEFVKNIPSIRYETVFKCKTCGYEEPLVFEGLRSFFG